MRTRSFQLLISAAVVGCLLPMPAYAKKKHQASETAAPVVAAPLPKDDPGCRQCISTAATMFATGKDREAAAFLKQWSDKCPRSAQMHLMLTTFLIRTGDFEGAEIESRKAIQAAPNMMLAHLQYGMALSTNNKPQQAIEAFRKACEIDPASYEAWTALAGLYKQMHQDELANEAEQKAADLEPGTKNIRLSVITNLKRTGKYSQAKTELKRLLAQNNSAEFSQELATQAVQLGAFEEAIEASNRVLQAHPRAQSAMRLAAVSQLAMQRYDDVEKTADQMLESDPSSADAHGFKAIALSRLGKFDDAEKEVDVCLEKHPSSGLGLLGRGMVEFHKGNLAASINALKESLEADGTNNQLQGLPYTLSHMTLSEVYRAKGMKAEAAEEDRAAAADKRIESLKGSPSPRQKQETDNSNF